MPKAFTDHEKDLIGKRLLNTGYKLFSVHGLKKTNVEELAETAGISKGAFYLFYESKEALFMKAAEMAEQSYRQAVLAEVDKPGLSPRARLFSVFKKAFELLKEMPILQFFTTTDYDLILRKVPAEKIQEHLVGDKLFYGQLVAHCLEEGIPIRVQPEELRSLLFPLVLTLLHEDDLNTVNFSRSLESLLELVAAFCLGEVELQFQSPI